MTQNLLPRRVPVSRATFDRHAGAVMVLMNAMFVRHLIGVYRAFGGDVAAAIVLGEVAHHNLAPLVNHARTLRQLSETLRTHDDQLQQALLPTNAFSIALATGIPRETVRRKIGKLTRRGWMSRDANGNLFVTASTKATFADSNYERVQDLLDVARPIGELLDQRSSGATRRVATRRTRRAHGTTASS